MKGKWHRTVGATPANTDPRASTVDLKTQTRHERQNEQGDADKHCNVAISLQNSVISDHQNDHDRHDHRDGGPHQLAKSRRLPAKTVLSNINPVDHRDADAVEEGGNGQNERVGLSRCHPKNNVHDQRKDGKSA